MEFESVIVDDGIFCRGLGVNGVVCGLSIGIVTLKRKGDQLENNLQEITWSSSVVISGRKRTFRDVVFDEFSGDLIIRIGFFVLFVDVVVAITVFFDLYGWLMIGIAVGGDCISLFILLCEVMNFFSFIFDRDLKCCLVEFWRRSRWSFSSRIFAADICVLERVESDLIRGEIIEESKSRNVLDRWRIKSGLRRRRWCGVGEENKIDDDRSIKNSPDNKSLWFQGWRVSKLDWRNAGLLEKCRRIGETIENWDDNPNGD